VIEKAGAPLDGFRALFTMNNENVGFAVPDFWPNIVGAFVSTDRRTSRGAP